MKFQVQLKDPDGFCDALQEAARQSVKDLGLPKDEQEAIRDLREDKFADFVSRWVDGGEYVTLEFDTEAGTATVLKKQ